MASGARVPTVPSEAVEIAALVRLENAAQVKAAIAAVLDGQVLRRSPCGGARLHFVSVDQELQAAFRDIEADPVPCPDEAQGTTDRRLGGNMQDDGAECRPAHACVGDADHVLHS